MVRKVTRKSRSTKKRPARKKTAKRKVAKRKPARKKAAKRKPARRKVAKRKPARKKAAKRKPARKAAKRKPAKRKVAKRKPARKKAAKRKPPRRKAVKRKPARAAPRDRPARQRVSSRKRVYNLTRDIPEHQYFVLVNGQPVKHVAELASLLDQLEDHVFHHHVTPDRNDFHNWVREVFEDLELARKISKVGDKKHLQLVIYKHLAGHDDK